MSYSLVVLGLLAEKPRHAYEMKQIIQMRGIDQYIRLSGGGIHYQIGKLLEDGYIERESTDRDKNYPERQIYRITDIGRAFFLEQLRDTFIDSQSRRYYDPVDTALAFTELLPAVEVAAYLEQQAHYIQSILMRLQVIYDLIKPDQVAPSSLVFIVNHSIHRKKSDLEWLRYMSAELRAKAAIPLPKKRTASVKPEQNWLELAPLLLSAQKVYQSKIQAAWHVLKSTEEEHHFLESSKYYQNYRAIVAKTYQEYEQALQQVKVQFGSEPGFHLHTQEEV